jgi:hypothetical protein
MGLRAASYWFYLVWDASIRYYLSFDSPVLYGNLVSRVYTMKMFVLSRCDHLAALNWGILQAVQPLVHQNNYFRSRLPDNSGFSDRQNRHCGRGKRTRSFYFQY